MLKYASKFFLEKILPSVVATVAGAYIVNHYVINNKPADAPVAAATSTADPKKAAEAKVDPKANAGKASAKASDGSVNVANIPEAGVRAKGISEKAIERTPVEKVIEKAEKPAETMSLPTEPKRHHQAQREKAVAKLTPAETAPSPDERRDATDLARSALERLRGTGESPVRPQEAAPRSPEPPRVAVQEAPRAVPPSIQPLPPAIMVSTPASETVNSDPKPSYARIENRRRPIPPADIPPADIPEASQPLDLEASAAPPAMRAHTTVADDMLSAAKSVFQAVIPR